MKKLKLEDIQGFVLRQYLLPAVRHFLLKVNNPAAARKALGRLVTGNEKDSPQITTAANGAVTPPYCLQIGITYPGLIELELKERVGKFSFKSFPAFVQGAAERAATVGDHGANGPEHWIDGFGRGDDHVLVTLYAANPRIRESQSARLAEVFAAGGAFAELWRGDGDALIEKVNGQTTPVPKVHFGYVDGIAQPTIMGAPEPSVPDRQQPCPPWLFVLLDEGENYCVPDPPELGRNGSFGVFKRIRQDVAGFENFLQSNKDKIDPELLAAKICGRWRNGVPLALSPDTDSPLGGIRVEKLNDFEYVEKGGAGDPAGLKCPVGSHIRRMNPRGQPVRGQGIAGGSNNTHRIVRRGMPYGPMFDPIAPDDGIERGLMAYFINTKIENQYEFALREWAHNYEFVGATRLHPKAKDVILGTQGENVFEIARAGEPPMQVAGFASFIRTEAAAYCFLPSITALKFIAGLR